MKKYFIFCLFLIKSLADFVDIQSLLSQMSVEDMCGQMTQLGIDVVEKDLRQLAQKDDPIDFNKLLYALRDKKVGSFINPPSGGAASAKKWQQVLKLVQSVATQNTSLKIPVLYGIDSIHGAGLVQEGVLFPQPLAVASSFNIDISFRIGEVTAMETRSVGIPWNFNPVLGVGRQPLWPRLYETYGEDVHLVSKMGQAYIRGHQGNSLRNRTKAAVCLKHYVGYSFPFNGHDRTPAYIPDNVLREIFLPSFQAGVESGAQSVMINSGEVNGMPGHANDYYMNKILKQELRFEGFTVSDWQDIIRLHTRDKVAESAEEAVRIAVMAGVDMSMVPSDFSFFDHCVNLSRKDGTFLKRVKDAVTRILKVKNNLGLFENPFPNEHDLKNVGSKESEQFNLEAARESIILAKNSGFLPLRNFGSKEKILVTGPTGNLQRTLNGGWSYTWQGDNEALYREYGRLKYTIFDSIKNKHQNAVFKKGANFESKSDNFNDTIRTAMDCALVVLCLGEEVYAETPGNIDNLMLSEYQTNLARALFELKKPVVVVYTGGRPRIITEVAQKADAVIIAFLPGSRGGEAIADVIFGDFNPNARLPVSYPLNPSGFTTYDYKPMEVFDSNKVEHLYPFGHGLSYTQFEYVSLEVNSTELVYPDSLLVTVVVKNIGKVNGKEIIMLFLNDHFGSISRPIRQLKKFEKIYLRTGESKKVKFVLDIIDLSFVNYQSERVAEPGKFNIYVKNLNVSFNLKIDNPIYF